MCCREVVLGWVKGKGSDFALSIGCEVGGVASSDALVNRPCMDVDMFFEEEPTSLRSCLTVAKQNCAGSMPSAWVLQTVKEIRHSVGLSGEGFEEELLALFTGIKASRSNQVSTSCSKLEKKGSRELIRLCCSIHYDVNNDNVSYG